MRGVCRRDGGDGGFFSCGCEVCGCKEVLDVLVDGVSARWLASEPATMALVSEASDRSVLFCCGRCGSGGAGSGDG